MRLSAEAEQIQPSIIRVMMMEAEKMAQDGFDVINAHVGAPTHAALDAAIDGAIAELEKYRGGPVPYTSFQGDPEARARIAEVRSEQSGLNIEADNVLLSVGVNGGFDLILRAITEPGESVITSSPFFVSYKPMVEKEGRVFDEIQTTAEGGYKITPEMLREKLESLKESPEAANDSVQATFLLVTPNNPTGAAYSKDEIVALLEVAQDYENVNVIADSIYREITFGDANRESIIAIAPEGMKKNIVEVESGSKADAIPGMRIADIITLEEGLASKMAAFQLQTTVHPSREAQFAYATALEERYQVNEQGVTNIEATRQYYEERAEVVERRGKEGGYMPESYELGGAFYAVLDVSFMEGQPMSEKTANMLGKKEGDPIESDLDAAVDLMSRWGIVAIPASGFGVEGNSVRLVYTEAPEKLEELFNRLDRAKAIAQGESQEPLPTEPPRAKPGNEIADGSGRAEGPDRETERG